MNKLKKLLKRGYIIRTFVFRKNLPMMSDWSKRTNPYTYELKSTKHHFPAPPSNDYVHVVGGVATIFIYSPRIGTYIYLKPPEVELNDTEDELEVKYKIKQLKKRSIHLWPNR